MPRLLPLLLLALAGVLVGLVDASRDGADDLVVLLAAVVVVLSVALWEVLRSRARISLRPDLAAWLRRQGAATGEPADRLADRCVAAYRAGLTRTEDPVR
ncbi:hypothetical protein [Blastococcus sp. VKM Ac-2987]|uniref:hypothetical protein n=1 Tax=Blastococcus sp. VKM Ac-2987 TaxID=3004141 RepID=UPI0022ABA555|nr:hypothetical protein [Blastococcus sp. VKM Ac-2987]MCZ2860613.1 hypothetical protein [Blastococcus sp. VKM Ac-2987]